MLYTAKTRFQFLKVLIIAIFAFNGCTPHDTPGPNPPGPVIVSVSGITLNLSSAYIKIDSTKQLTATVTPDSASNKKVTWRSSNPAIATVDANGLVTALKEGTIQITVISDANASIIATATITVLKNYELYISGNGVGFPNPGNVLAWYWKNGLMYPLPGGQNGGSWGKAITVAGNIIYVAGTTNSPHFFEVPTLWVNGAPLELATPVDDPHYANGVAVSGNDIYVSGYKYTLAGGGQYNASLWKVNNSVVSPITLPAISGMTQSDAFAVATIGADVYTAGGVFNNSFGYATLWKNNAAPILLSPSSTWGKANAITTSGNDVYVAGYEGCPNFGCAETFKLWKNGAANSISFGSTSSFEFEITGIAVSGSNVYISGSVANANHFYVATLWKITGSTVTTIPLSDGTKSVYANGVTASGDDVFVVGCENFVTPNSLNAHTRCWRLFNTTLVETTEPQSAPNQLPVTGGNGRAFGVFIK